MDRRKYVMRPGEMEPKERAKLARSLPLYLTRAQAAELAGVKDRTIDRWMRWWDESFATPAFPQRAGMVGLKRYYSRTTTHDMAEQPPGDIRVSKIQLLERIGFDPDTVVLEPERIKVETIAEGFRGMV